MDTKSRWETFYQTDDPYGNERWYSDFQRRKTSLDLIFKRGLHFKNCLELGCGEGRVTEYMLPICDYVTAVDISANAINRAKNRVEDIQGNVAFIEGDIYQIDFKAQRFDLINGMESLDYTKERQKEISKWCTWLQDDGYILFSAPNLEDYFTYKELRTLFQRPELEVIEFVPITSKFPLQFIINRVKLLQNEFMWNLTMFITRLFPSLFGKHFALLVKKVGN